MCFEQNHFVMPVNIVGWYCFLKCDQYSTCTHSMEDILSRAGLSLNSELIPQQKFYVPVPTELATYTRNDKMFTSSSKQ